MLLGISQIGLSGKSLVKTMPQEFVPCNVTLNNNQVVVMIHMSFVGRSLYFCPGVLSDQGFSITTECRNLGKGMRPALSLSDNNKLIEIHRDNIGSSL